MATPRYIIIFISYFYHIIKLFINFYVFPPPPPHTHTHKKKKKYKYIYKYIKLKIKITKTSNLFDGGQDQHGQGVEVKVEELDAEVVEEDDGGRAAALDGLLEHEQEVGGVPVGDVELLEELPEVVVGHEADGHKDGAVLGGVETSSCAKDDGGTAGDLLRRCLGVKRNEGMTGSGGRCCRLTLEPDVEVFDVVRRDVGGGAGGVLDADGSGGFGLVLGGKHLRGRLGCWCPVRGGPRE